MSAHSAILGGSNAARLVACPASYQESLKAKVVDVPSPYADRGTLLHKGIAHCITYRISAASLRDGQDRDYTGEVIGAEDVAVLADALDALETIKKAYGSSFRVVAIEKLLPLPGVTGAFGSVDLVLANKSVVLTVDWKFGQGVSVPVLKTDGDEEMLNAQLVYYTLAARAAYPRRFKGKKIVIAVVQPSMDPPADYTETDNEELDAWLVAFTAAYHEALGRNPRMERGDHCRFAICKGTCPLWTGPVFELADINPAAAALQASQSLREERGYGQFLGRALDLATYAEAWITEVRRQAHVYLEGGADVSGYKLVPKRGTRQWLKPDVVDTDLLALGATEEDIWAEPKLRSVGQVKKLLKTRGIAVPENLYSVVSTGTTIATADDSRPVANQPGVTIELQKALAAL